MSKQTIKFQSVYPDPPSQAKAKARKSKGYTQKPKDLSLKVFLNSLPVGFIRTKPSFTVVIKGKSLAPKPKSLGEAKAQAINHITETLCR